MTRRFSDRPLNILVLIIAQVVCAGYFLADVVVDGLTEGWRPADDPEFIPEMLITLTLVAAIYVECLYLRFLLRRKRDLERQLSIATGAFHTVLNDHFDRWSLTPAERDVALFTVKGFSIAEIAGHRGSAEGTVKSQLNSIYRKADVGGRGALLGLLIEDLMQDPLIAPADAPTLPGQSPRAADPPHRSGLRPPRSDASRRPARGR